MSHPWSYGAANPLMQCHFSAARHSPLYQATTNMQSVFKPSFLSDNDIAEIGHIDELLTNKTTPLYPPQV